MHCLLHNPAYPLLLEWSLLRRRPQNGHRRIDQGWGTMAWESPRDGPLQCDGSPFHPHDGRAQPPLYPHCTIPPTRSCTKVKLVVAELPQCDSILLHFYVIRDVRLVSRESLFICPFARPAIRIQCMGRLSGGGLL